MQVLLAPHPITVVIAIIVLIVRMRSRLVSARSDAVLPWHRRRVADDKSYYPHHALVYRIAPEPRDLNFFELD
jgi:hypothetical protein